jgi:hypothetical protein
MTRSSRLGAVMDRGEHFTTEIEPGDDWVGITVAHVMTPNSNRVAFAAPSRGTVATVLTYLPAIGARNIKPPDETYEPMYYACFFEDLD